jgi:hypothetical protein
MDSSFVLGFIAGEGTFSTESEINDKYRFNLLISPKFQVKVKEEDVVREMRDTVGLGQVNVYGDYGVWRISSNDEFDELIKWIDRNADNGFSSTHKWRKFVNDRHRMMKTRDGMKELIDLTRTINDASARTNARSVEELKEVVDSAEVYVCGKTTNSGDPCEQVVSGPDVSCYRHA